MIEANGIGPKIAVLGSSSGQGLEAFIPTPALPTPFHSPPFVGALRVHDDSLHLGVPLVSSALLPVQFLWAFLGVLLAAHLAQFCWAYSGYLRHHFFSNSCELLSARSA